MDSTTDDGGLTIAKAGICGVDHRGMKSATISAFCEQRVPRQAKKVELKQLMAKYADTAPPPHIDGPTQVPS